MAHPTRGHRTGTYEITAIVGIDPVDLSLHVRHAGAYQPQTFTLRAKQTEASRQMLRALSDSIKVAGNGDAFSGWESMATVRNAFHYSAIMLDQLHLAGFESFSDPSLTVMDLRGLYAPLLSSTKRSASWLLCRVVKDNHPDGPALAAVLRNTRFGVEQTHPFTYDDAVSDAIEKSARTVYTNRYVQARDLFAALGFDVAGRGWLRIPAEDLIAWAWKRHPQVCAADAPAPSAAADTATCAAWALTHPERFGYLRKRGRQHVMAFNPQLQRVGSCLYPDHVLLTAALVLHCLGENSGYNQSVLLEKNAASLTRLGTEHALEHNVKARNATQDTRATQTSSIYTPGGIIEVLTGLTRFSRHDRRTRLASEGRCPPIVDRLYVEHTQRAEQARVLGSDRLHNAWRSNEFDADWDQTAAGPRDEAPLRLAALRLVAQRRAMGEGLTADVHGHSDAVKTHYSAHVLPDHVFNVHATAAQDAFHDEAVAKFTLVADATDGPAADLAAVDPSEVMDVEIGLCTSGGNAPDGSGRRCDLGMVACFTCPNGYRTVDHVPGLIAAVELADIIERNDPEEWADGQASRLRYYADACLREFPPAVVATVKRTADIPGHILTVTGMYMEMRHG